MFRFKQMIYSYMRAKQKYGVQMSNLQANTIIATHEILDGDTDN